MPYYRISVNAQSLDATLAAIREVGGDVVPDPLQDPTRPPTYTSEAEAIAAVRDGKALALTFQSATPISNWQLIVGDKRVYVSAVQMPPSVPEKRNYDGSGEYTLLPVRVYGPDEEDITLDENGTRPVLHVSYDSMSAVVSVDLEDLVDYLVTYRPELLEARRIALAASKASTTPTAAPAPRQEPPRSRRGR